MGSFKVLVAAALLMGPGKDLPVADQAQLHAAVGPALRSLAIRWEIMDPREAGELLAQPDDFANGLQILRARYRELANAPPACEALRFPGREVVGDVLAFNRTYQQELTSRLAVDTIHGEELRAALLETEHLHAVWDCVLDARCGYRYVTVRRQALQRLRELVGDRAFYSGELPPHVPLWRIPTAD